MYPIKNLENLYDKEGYRDGEFKKGDKGTGDIKIFCEATSKVKSIAKVWYYILIEIRGQQQDIIL